MLLLVRTLHSEFGRAGVSMKCLCPAWADTEIVSGVKEEHKATVQKIVSAGGGLMTTEHVAEGLLNAAVVLSSPL